MSAWYGSVNNRIMETAQGPVPAVGMGVTEYYWSDRHPYEIIAIKDDRHITVREMGHKRPDGYTCYGMGDNTWEVYSNPDGRIVNLFRKKNGRWVEKVGRREGCNTFGIGHADYYYDYEF